MNTISVHSIDKFLICYVTCTWLRAFIANLLHGCCHPVVFVVRLTRIRLRHGTVVSRHLALHKNQIYLKCNQNKTRTIRTKASPSLSWKKCCIDELFYRIPLFHAQWKHYCLKRKGLCVPVIKQNNERFETSVDKALYKNWVLLLLLLDLNKIMHAVFSAIFHQKGLGNAIAKVHAFGEYNGMSFLRRKVKIDYTVWICKNVHAYPWHTRALCCENTTGTRCHSSSDASDEQH